MHITYIQISFSFGAPKDKFQVTSLLRFYSHNLSFLMTNLKIFLELLLTILMLIWIFFFFFCLYFGPLDLKSWVRRGKTLWMPRPLTLGLHQQCLDFQRKDKIKSGKVPLYCHFF